MLIIEKPFFKLIKAALSERGRIVIQDSFREKLCIYIKNEEGYEVSVCLISYKAIANFNTIELDNIIKNEINNEQHYASTRSGYAKTKSEDRIRYIKEARSIIRTAVRHHKINSIINE